MKHIGIDIDDIMTLERLATSAQLALSLSWDPSPLAQIQPATVLLTVPLASPTVVPPGASAASVTPPTPPATPGTTTGVEK